MEVEVGRKFQKSKLVSMVEKAGWILGCCFRKLKKTTQKVSLVGFVFEHVLKFQRILIHRIK